jgi:hypothetical protein
VTESREKETQSRVYAKKFHIRSIKSVRKFRIFERDINLDDLVEMELWTEVHGLDTILRFYVTSKYFSYFNNDIPWQETAFPRVDIEIETDNVIFKGTGILKDISTPDNLDISKEKSGYLVDIKKLSAKVKPIVGSQIADQIAEVEKNPQWR